MHLPVEQNKRIMSPMEKRECRYDPFWASENHLAVVRSTLKTVYEKMSRWGRICDSENVSSAWNSYQRHLKCLNEKGNEIFIDKPRGKGRFLMVNVWEKIQSRVWKRMEKILTLLSKTFLKFSELNFEDLKLFLKKKYHFTLVYFWSNLIFSSLIYKVNCRNCFSQYFF